MHPTVYACTRCKATQTACGTLKSAVETRAFPWLGRRTGLTGWTPYPCSSARADAPCGPFAALGQTPSTCALPRTADSHRKRARSAFRTHLPDRSRGRGCTPPDLRQRGWSRSRLGPRALPGSPAGAHPALGGGTLLRAPALCSRAGALRPWGACAERPPILGVLAPCPHPAAFVQRSLCMLHNGRQLP